MILSKIESVKFMVTIIILKFSGPILFRILDLYC